MTFQNIVVGKPIIDEFRTLISSTIDEFETCDREYTLFTEERFLPKLLVDAGITTSISEVRRNKPELCINLDHLDCLWVKWGKKKVFIIVGE